MAKVDDGSDARVSPMLGTSSNYGSPHGSGPDLDGMGRRSINAQFNELRECLLPLARGFADFDKQVKSICEAVGIVTSRITSVEQTVNAPCAKVALFAAMEEDFISLTARTCQIEANATFASSRSGSASSWHVLRHSGGSTATLSLWSHGPVI